MILKNTRVYVYYYILRIKKDKYCKYHIFTPSVIGGQFNHQNRLAGFIRTRKWYLEGRFRLLESGNYGARTMIRGEDNDQGRGQ